MHGSRPSWQVGECPPWCASEHQERDHPDDRVHRSHSVAVPVTVRQTSFVGASIRREAGPSELEIALSRIDGDAETWVYVGDGPARNLELTVESGERVLRAISAVLGRARSR